jgi:Tfp pilus assembly protein PilF
MAEAQVGSSLLTWFKCEGSPQRSMARQMLKDVSPEQSHTAEYVLLLECKNPRDRELAEKYVLQSSLAEQRQDLLHTLGVARQYRSVGDHEKAVQEYDIAYNELPESFHSKKVALIAQKAREAFDNRDFRTASDLFEEAFSMIATH